MMPNSLYNTDLALATRVALILDARPHLYRSVRALAAIDLLTTNAAQFGLFPRNLHGETIYVATEFAARTQHVERGIRYAVTRGLITPHMHQTGIQFDISDAGKSFVEALASQYKDDYQQALNPVLSYVDSRPESAVIRRIEQQGMEQIKEDRP
ncbi:hypothetical protein J2S49_001584 [Arcanobacterium wilhelmae]|uniref:Uncharacterized protein n=1 Tax=Arcanobacterium wilhelmae TaxID=1803177 RepID=A0ABT9NCU3_9ACTO|nr:ABC-three component system middle component 2 [Arcanobacterium wilhelmae]MDP9801508.1 hypothetical protein [Arcanobacterium wilhelmae]